MSDWPVTIRKGTGKLGVVMIHDISGLDAVNLSFADKLAAEGFWVAAVDIFRGHQLKTLDEGMAVRQKLTNDDLTSATKAGIDALRHAMGPGAIVGSLGFCMGGGVALHGASVHGLAFCVDWYGTSPNADDVKGLGGPVLLILASEDARVNGWAFTQLLPKMAEHKKRVQVQLYPAVVHPFHRPDWIKSPWTGAPAYDRNASDDAWRRIFAFIREQVVAPELP